MSKKAIVIGGSSGIGYECIKLLKREEYGSYEIINISRSECILTVNNVRCDISKGNIAEAVGHVLQTNPETDLLIYSAGFSMCAPVEYTLKDDARYLFEVNFFGFCEVLKTVLPHFKTNHGTIIAVSSVAGVVPIPFDAYYSASKAALDMFIRTAAIEAKPYGVNIMSFQPGGTSTEFTFKRKVYSKENVCEYAGEMARAEKALANIEQNGMSPSSVAREIVAAIRDCSETSNGTAACNILNNERSPKTVQTCGLVNKGICTTTKVLPKKLVDKLAALVYKQ